MGKRIEIDKPWCHRCNASHQKDQHLAKLKRAAPSQDGVALKSASHPVGRKRAPEEITPESLETVEAPAAVAAEMDRLGPDGVAKRKADRKKRVKAEQKVLDEAEAARKRALKTARQARWRAKQKKPKKKRKARK